MYIYIYIYIYIHLTNNSCLIAYYLLSPLTAGGRRADARGRGDAGEAVITVTATITITMGATITIIIIIIICYLICLIVTLERRLTSIIVAIRDAGDKSSS